MKASEPLLPPSVPQPSVPWEADHAPAAAKPKMASRRRVLPDPFSRTVDRLVIALTAACATSLILGCHGAHPSNTRELLPILTAE